MTLKDFAKSIRGYAHKMKLQIIKSAVPTWVVNKYELIDDVVDDKSLVQYLEEIINLYQPDEIVIIGGQRNGSGVINPKEFSFKVEKSTPAAAAKNEMDNLGNPGLHTSSSSSPMSEMYKFQYDHVNRELQKTISELDKYKSKFETLQEKHAELKQQFDTQEAKFDLERQKSLFDEKNTLLAVAKEFRPEINGLMGVIGEKVGLGGTTKNQIPANTQTQNDNSVIQNLVGIFNEFDLTNLHWVFEIVVRSFNLSADDKIELMSFLRERSSKVTENLESTLKTLTQK